MRVRLVAALATVAAITATAVAPPATSGAADEVTVTAGRLAATVTLEPFGITFTDGGEEVLANVGAPGTGGTPPAPTPDRAGALGFAVGPSVEAHQLGYHLGEQQIVWLNATTATATGPGTFEVATDDPLGRTFELTVAPRADGIIDVTATLSDTASVSLTGAAFGLGDSEHLLGFGERSDAVDQTGNVVTTWNEEGPFSPGVFAPVTEPVYGDRWQGPTPFPGTNFAMPWFVSSRGYGFLLDSTWMNEFDAGATDPTRWQVATREPELRYRVFAGPTPADVVTRFTEDTGRQPEPAEWFFGPWLQPGPEPSFWREEDLPLTVAQTYAHYLPCAAHSGNREAQRERVAGWHSHGIRVTTYVNSFVCSGHPDGAYDEGDANGWFLQHPTGGTYPVPYVAYVQPDGPYHGLVDFTDPEASAWWQGLIVEAIEDGYDGWMEDFGEYVPVDAVTSDGQRGLEHHNRYCVDYHRASHELTWPLKGTDFAQFVRCGYTGAAPYSRIVWGADPSEDFSRADGLAAAVSQGISMGLSGIGYWGSDVGGFHAVVHADRASAELQSRWLQLGAFSGVMRTQGNGYPRPSLGPIDTHTSERAQVYLDPVKPIWRRYAKLRTQLFPYIWDVAVEYRATGMPMMRHLALEWPDDPEVYAPQAEYEFLFGPSLLVAPVIEDGARTREVYLPEGDWVAFWDAVTYDEATGAFDEVADSTNVEVIAGPTTVTVDAPLEQIPVFVVAGTCLELLPADTFSLAGLPTSDPLDEAMVQRRAIGFAADCGAGGPSSEPGDDGVGAPPAPLPATGGGVALALVAVLGAGRLGAVTRRRRHRVG